MSTGLWFTPLLLLPGVALLVMSTSARFNRLHDELHELEPAELEPIRDHMGRRARLFRDSLVSLYLAVALLALASVSGALGSLAGWSPRWIVAGLSALAVIALLWASALLVVESRLSLQILEQHLGRELGREHGTGEEPGDGL